MRVTGAWFARVVTRDNATKLMITLVLWALVPSMVWLFLAEELPVLGGGTSLDCARPASSDAGGPVTPVANEEPTVPLELSGVQDQRLVLGRTRDARSTTATLTVAATDEASADAARGILADRPQVDVRARTFTRVDGAELHPEAVQTWAQVVGNQIDLTLCVRPEVPVSGDGDQTRAVEPGVYTGSVVVQADGLVPSAVTFTVTRSFERWWSVVALAVLSSAAAIVWIYVLRTGERTDEDECRRRQHSRFTLFSGDFVDWIREPASAISIATGAVGAAAVYSSTYLKAEDWGSSAPAFLSFVGAVFTAFLTGATAGKLAENRGRTTADPARRGPADAAGGEPRPGAGLGDDVAEAGPAAVDEPDAPPRRLGRRRRR